MRTPSSPSRSPALDSLTARRPQLLASVRRRVRCPADAEDIVQTAFLRFVERRELLRADDLALPWFRGILANATADHFRRRGALSRALQALASEPREPAEVPGSPPPEPPETAMALLDQLRPQYRQVLHAVYLEARPLPALAEQAGITVNNAAVRVWRAKQAARKLAGNRAASLAAAAAA